MNPTLFDSFSLSPVGNAVIFTPYVSFLVHVANFLSLHDHFGRFGLVSGTTFILFNFIIDVFHLRRWQGRSCYSKLIYLFIIFPPQFPCLHKCLFFFNPLCLRSLSLLCIHSRRFVLFVFSLSRVVHIVNVAKQSKRTVILFPCRLHVPTVV